MLRVLAASNDLLQGTGNDLVPNRDTSHTCAVTRSPAGVPVGRKKKQQRRAVRIGPPESLLVISELLVSLFGVDLIFDAENGVASGGGDLND
jgi:hypothetical protein